LYFARFLLGAVCALYSLIGSPHYLAITIDIMKPFTIAKLVLQLACLLVLSEQAFIRRLAIACPNGTTLMARPGYSPLPNGCGGSSIQVLLGQGLNPFTPLFEPCCNGHDSCFGRCDIDGENSFARCNDKLKECLKNQCGRLPDVFFLR
jgi:hypothetical protein